MALQDVRYYLNGDGRQRTAHCCDKRPAHGGIVNAAGSVLQPLGDCAA